MNVEDINQCKEKYKKAKQVHTIMRTVAQATDTELEKLYREIVWPLNKKFESANDAFKVSLL